MALKLHPVAGKAKAVDMCNAFAAGAPKDAIGHVFYGVKDDNYRAWQRALQSGESWYLIDNSFFDSVRGQQYRVTKNAIQVRHARHHQTDGKRFANLGLEIKPWQHNPGGHWLVIEQSEVFMRLTARDPMWFERTIMALKHDLTREVRVRSWGRDKLKIQRTLIADLEGCWALRTHTSAAAVTAVMEGIPVHVESQHALSGMTCSDDNDYDDRRHYLSVLADNQFGVAEMQEGVAWRHLNK